MIQLFRGRLSLDHVWIAAAIALILVGPLVTAVPPNDLWFHVATGRRIITEGVIPTTDAFSYTRAGEPFRNQAWLAQVLLFGMNQAGGVPLLLLIHALTLLLAYGLLLRLCVRRGGNLRACIALFLATLPVSFASWNVRPQSFAFPLFVGFLYVLSAYRLGWFNRLWLLPVLMLLWVNVHGTFPLGLALIGATLVGMLFERRAQSAERRAQSEGQEDKKTRRQEDRKTQKGFRVQSSGFIALLPWLLAPGSWLHSSPFLYNRQRTNSLRPLIIWGVITALAILLNPTGVGVLLYVRDLTSNNAVTQLVSEWAPPTIREPGGMFFFAFLIVGALVLAYARRKPDLVDWLMLLPLLWLALGANRNVAWFALVAIPVFTMAACSLLPSAGERAPGVAAINGVLIGLLAGAVVLCLPWVKPLWLPGPRGELLKNTPVAAVAWLREQPDRPSRLYHTEAHGSYLTYAAPEQKVFIDPRIELYPFGQWADYLALNGGNNLEALRAKYDFDGMLLSKEYQALLIEQMRQTAGWSQEYEDDLVVYLRRR